MQFIKSLILACLLCSAFCGHTQETKQNIFLKRSPIYKQWDVKLSNSFNSTALDLSPNLNDSRNPLYLCFANFRTEVNYGLLSCLQVGGYVGYSWEGYMRIEYNSDRPKESAYAINYGAQLNFHPLGLFLNRNRNSVDIWLSGKFGQSSEHAFSDKYWDKRWLSYTEYGLGGGIAYFPFEHERLGFYFEFSSGHWLLKKRRYGEDMGRNDFRWGVSYKFRK